jgi:hypothetical protein
MLRRTAFKRRLYVPAPVAPLRPITDAVRGVLSMSSQSVVAVPKIEPVRSEPYRRWIASHPCIWCGVAGFSQCAHDNTDKGMAMKVSDLRTFPLCGPRFGLVGCHQQFDLCIGITREERRSLGASWTARMQGLAKEAGRPEIVGAA